LWNDVLNQDAIFGGQIQCLYQRRRNRANQNSQLMMMYVVVISDLPADRTHHVAGNGETHSFVATRLGENEGIYPHHLSQGVH